jgi:HAE1 family hydrophobic/amphiphilic exporter-1/multidrug efflux pump
MKRKWISFPILIACFVIYVFYNLIQKKQHLIDDRSLVLRMTTP